MSGSWVIPSKERERGVCTVPKTLAEPPGPFSENTSVARLDRARLPASPALPRQNRGLLSGAALKTGYVPQNELLDQAVNRSLAAVLLVLLGPVFLVIMALQKLTSPGPVFYSGWRLGKDRSQFRIFKFRTLSPDAEKITRTCTLPRRNMTETPLGAYLRKTRLDELPQLVNILRGEMVFMGPRPVRPEIEWLYKAEVEGYEDRFRVRPGLVGLSQALMTHETPKALRSRFNRMCCRAPVRYHAMLGLVAYVGFCVLRKSVTSAVAALRDRARLVPEHGWLRSGFSRPKGCRVDFLAGNEPVTGAICGMSDEIIQFVSTRPVRPGDYELILSCRRRSRRNFRLSVMANVEMSVPLGPGQSGFVNYATYSPRTRAARHFIERYFLQSAVIPA